jgi:hypothetical protein
MVHSRARAPCGSHDQKRGYGSGGVLHVGKNTRCRQTVECRTQERKISENVGFFVVADSRSSVDKKAQFLCGFQQISGLYCTSAGALGSGEIGGRVGIEPTTN